jgi:hypothetical protein
MISLYFLSFVQILSSYFISILLFRTYSKLMYDCTATEIYYYTVAFIYIGIYLYILKSYLKTYFSDFSLMTSIAKIISVAMSNFITFIFFTQKLCIYNIIIMPMVATLFMLLLSMICDISTKNRN